MSGARNKERNKLRCKCATFDVEICHYYYHYYYYYCYYYYYYYYYYY